MTDRRKRKADLKDDSSIEILPPPSTQPPPKKLRPNRNAAPANFPSSLRPVFAPNTRTSSASSSRPNTAFSSRPAKAKPQVDSDKDHDSNNSNHDNSVSLFAKSASEFKAFLKSQIKTDHGAARLETNNQGGKGPSARARAEPTSASTKSGADSGADQARALKTSEWRVQVVMILPNGVKPAPRGQRNRYNSPFDIQGHAFWNKDIGYLGCEGFSIRDPDGFVFDDKWSEERFFKEICSLLPDAAQRLIDNHDPVKNGPCQWLPCLKEAYSGNFIVSPASGPYTGSVMRDIALSGRQRGVSTTKIRISDDDSEVSDNEIAIPGPSTSPAKPGLHSTQPPVASSSRILRSTNAKKAEIITVTDDDYSSEADSNSFPDWYTEPAASRAGSPQGDLDRSFSGIHLDTSLLHDCHPELPAEAAYCSSP
ncbi:hypothetical protein BJ165DRAFT_1531888 [Panaeolus papilionaceus]|nr:hypothetical protein BJ165DRAFT_1531888 [Panaeolus papilionaceus]